MKSNTFEHVRSVRMSAATIFMTAMVFCGLLFYPPHATRAVTEQDSKPDLARFFRQYQIITLNARQLRADAVRTKHIRLPLSEGGQSLGIELTPHDLRAPDYRAEQSSSQSLRQSLPQPSPVTTFRGRLMNSVSGIATGSEVRLTLDGTRVEGVIFTDNMLYIEPVSKFDATLPSEQHILYRRADLITTDDVPSFDFAHAVEASVEQRQFAMASMLQSGVSHITNGAPMPLRPDALPTPGATYTARIATEADFEYVTALGGADAANNEILSILNVVDGVYSKEIGLTFQVSYQHAWTTAGEPYKAQAANDIIVEFKDYWNNNFQNVSRDLTHLFTGRSASSSTDNVGGLAYTSTACLNSPIAYGLSRYSSNAPVNFKFDLTAHEIGHNLGANHPNDVQPATTGLYGSASCANTIMGPNNAQSSPMFCGYSRLEILDYLREVGACGHTALRGIVYEPQGSDFQTVNGIVITLRDTKGNIKAVQSSGGGRYIFVDIPSGNYILSGSSNDPVVAAAVGHDYTLNNLPVNYYLNIVTTMPVSQSLGVNTTIDGPAFFVRQHYIDFLNRAPDPDGLNFWTNQIASCGTDATCIDTKRQNVSAAFFLSTEFQNTGFLVHRLYEASYGRAPRIQEFMPDSQTISNGVVVTPDNSNHYKELLESNKQNFAAAFVARPAFLSAYPTSLTAAQYVDALIANSKVSFAPADRDPLVNGLISGTETRATVLRKIAENASFTQQQFAPAFVLMQYFGYLRRNPDSAPDTDSAGYQFWLNKLNSFGGDYIRSEMVRSFIVSQEYHARF